MKKTTNYRDLTASVATMSLTQARRAKSDALRRVDQTGGNRFAIDYLRATEARISELEFAKIEREESERVLSAEDQRRLFSSIEHAEAVLTSINPTVKDGSRRAKHTLSRTRQSFTRHGVSKAFFSDFAPHERSGNMQDVWHKNLWAILSTDPTKTMESVAVDNAYRLNAQRVGTTWDILEAILPIYSLPVPPRPAHSVAPNLKAQERMIEDHLRVTGRIYEAHPNLPKVERINFSIQRRKALERAGGVCEYVGCQVSDLSMLHVHHVIHRADGGSDHADNLLVLCANHHAWTHYSDAT